MELYKYIAEYYDDRGDYCDESYNFDALDDEQAFSKANRHMGDVE